MKLAYPGHTKVHAVINQKGGVGKTTTTANLGYTYAKMGYDVLLIDFDCQASLTNYFNVGLRSAEYNSVHEALYKLFAEQDEVDLDGNEFVRDSSWEEFFDSAIVKPQYIVSSSKIVDGERKLVEDPVEFGISLLPSKMELSGYGLEIAGARVSAATQMMMLIDKILQWHEYDYILIDCSPALDILTTNAIAASLNGIIIPTNLDMMSLRGVKNLINTVAEIQTHFVLKKEMLHYGVAGIVLNLYADRRTVDRDIQSDMLRFYPFKIFESCIPESIDAKKATMSGRTYCQLNKKAEKAYENLAIEIIEKEKQMEAEGPHIYTLTDEGWNEIKKEDE